MMQLFLLTGVFGERLSDTVGVMHLVAITLVTISACTGHLKLRWRSLLKFAGRGDGTRMPAGGHVASRPASRTYPCSNPKSASWTGCSCWISPPPVKCWKRPRRTPTRCSRASHCFSASADAARSGSVSARDKLPFAYFNRYHALVGFDISMAHELARDLGVRIEFVPFDRATLADQLAADHFDVVMSGLVGTLERAESMPHTKPYMDLTLALVVPDYRVRSFKSVELMRQTPGLRLGFVDVSRGLVDRMQARLPNAEFVELATNQQYFDVGQRTRWTVS